MKLRKTQDWYVGFLPGHNVGFWRIAGGRFTHCLAFRPTRLGWLLVEHAIFGLEVAAYSSDELRAMVDGILADGALLHVPARRREWRWWAPPMLTCVTALGALCGVRDWMITPRQLHGALLRRGATVVSENPL